MRGAGARKFAVVLTVAVGGSLVVDAALSKPVLVRQRILDGP